MSKLTDLVPPLELCRMIPAGEFEDSALIWVNAMDNQPKVICRPWDKKSTAAPAPTLQDILAELPHDDAYNDLMLSYSAKVDKFTGWHIYYSGDRKRHCYNKNAATAALKLWLKLKGIKNE